MNKEWKWRFKPHLDICGSCTKFLEPSSQQKALETIIDDYQEVFSSVNLLTQSAKRRVRKDHNGCAYMSEDGYCTYWSYNRRQWDKDQKRDIYEQKTVYRDYVKKHPEICASCPSYKPKG